MIYLVTAYGGLRAISFALVFSMVWRQRRLESELHTLAALVDDVGTPQAANSSGTLGQAYPGPQAGGPTAAALHTPSPEAAQGSDTLQDR